MSDKYICMTVDYIEKISDYSVDLEKLVNEFKLVEHLLVDIKRTDASVLAQKSFKVVSFNIPFKQSELTPYTIKVTRKLQLKYDLHNVMYRCLMPDTCYRWHTDMGKKCIHIPIITNEGSRFVYEDKSFYMPADGSAYFVNNEKYHSFMNGGKNPRIHITIENL